MTSWVYDVIEPDDVRRVYYMVSLHRERFMRISFWRWRFRARRVHWRKKQDIDPMVVSVGLRVSHDRRLTFCALCFCQAVVLRRFF